MKHIEQLAMNTTIDYPTCDEQQAFREEGLELDSFGRPLHPWHDTLPDLLEGKGFYWQWGPNYTVDPIVIACDERPKILLVRRHDNGKWALPGGFIDGNETAYDAGIREVAEETHLTLEPVDTRYCYRGPVCDERSRLHAWSDTTTIMWHTETAASVQGGDDAEDAQWVSLHDIPTLGTLHGSHATLIDMAIRDHGSLHEKLDYFGEASEIIEPSGGHMGYTRLIASLPNDERIFVKRHDMHRFTDNARAEHSKRYLRKEHHVYSQLQNSSPHVPQHVELVGDHTLLLEAYDPRDGWHWKAPKDIDERRQYVNDIIGALQSLESTPYAPFDEINPSYQTMIDEGWGEFPRQRARILEKLAVSRVSGASELAKEIDGLYERAWQLDTPEMTHFAHYDIRQSNIAWHPQHGVRIVDWSWADHAPSGVDTTSFLIDLAKAGYDINEYASRLDPHHILVLIGFWLGHSVWPTPTPDQTVREHQIGSAVAAFRLLKSLAQ